MNSTPLASSRHAGLAAALFALLTTTAVFAADTIIVGEPRTPADEATIRALEEESRLAVLHRDFATLERIWVERFVVNAPINHVLPSRAAVLELFRRGIGVYSSHEKSIECIVFDGDVTIVMGAEAVVPLNAPAASQPVQRRFTNIWKIENGHWRLIARQSTRIAPGAPSGP